MASAEINFDGIIGPTHNYSGLSEGNLASQANQGLVSRPRAAALQGLAKMRMLADMGLLQGVLPPHERPDIAWLRSLGFSGSDRDVWARAWLSDVATARAAGAASSMWAANAATVSPSADCEDQRLHLSVANLATMLHRSLEAPTTERALRRIMSDDKLFCVHPALSSHAAFADEGAANHMRMCAPHGGVGVEIFVYGRSGFAVRPGFPARQTLEASQAVARRHGLVADRTLFARQSDAAIDAGAFHNDVVAVAHENVLFHHEDAFADTEALYAEIRAKAADLFEPVFVMTPRAEVSLQAAISSYLFNAQLLRRPGAHRLTLLAPIEARENNQTAAFLSAMTNHQEAPIAEALFVDVRESMRNGGGPACLRLRIVMDEEERRAAAAGFFLTPALHDALAAWVMTHYRETISLADLADPAMVDETRVALDALTQILPLGSDFYPFQRA